MSDTTTLGTLLRHLIETLDGAVAEAYAADGLAYLPRYTPVMRALLALGPSPLRAIATHAGISHSAVSQTVAQMVRAGLIALRPGADARERIADLTPAGRRMVPALRRHWDATARATRSLDADCSAPLSQVVREALAALDRRPFSDRIAAALPTRRRAARST